MIKDKDGRVLVVRQSIDEPMLIFLDIQQGNLNNHEQKIVNCTAIGNTNGFALKYEYKQKVHYVKVDKGKLTISLFMDYEDLNSHLFKRSNQGVSEYYHLQSVAEPEYFLSMHPVKSSEVTLSNLPQYHVLITHLLEN